MKTVVVENRQTLLDIAIQEFGSVEGIFLVLADDKTANQYQEVVDNAGFTIQVSLGIMSNLIAGQQIKLKSSPINLPIANYYAKRNIKPITNYEFSIDEASSLLRDHNQFDYNPLDYH
jgi:hypothetical protein